MSRFQGQPFKQPYQPKPKFGLPPSVLNKPYIGERVVDKGSISNLFSVMMDGDYQKIKNVISDKNITLNVRNDDGQSLIHAVLENNSTGMKPAQKLELIQYLINNGASVTAKDKNNVTPLHLACKYQLPKIVKLLLDNGTEPNKQDN